jgi:hypothetical protein
VVAPVPSGWKPRGVADRFRRVFGKPLLVVANETVASLAPAPGRDEHVAPASGIE